jgi:hypothetical protein
MGRIDGSILVMPVDNKGSGLHGGMGLKVELLPSARSGSRLVAFVRDPSWLKEAAGFVVLAQIVLLRVLLTELLWQDYGVC